MEKIKFLLLIILYLFVSSIIHAQTGKIDGTYVWDMTKYLTITKDSFKLYLYTTYPLFYGLNMGDTILAEGEVIYESDDYIRLNSKDYEQEAKENMVVLESHDSNLKDSLKFKFCFPFEGKYKITIYLFNDYSNRLEFENRKEVIIPVHQDSIITFSFGILNQTPVESSYLNYLKTVSFNAFKYKAQSNNSNLFEISIHGLTNSYFARYLINGEYIKISKDKDILFWHNEQYWRFGRNIQK